MLEKIFYINLIVHYCILLLVVWWIIFFEKRIWPPPKKESWQYYIYWILFYIWFWLDFYLIIQNYNTWIITDLFRFYVGISLFVLWWLFSLWWIYALWIINTYWLKNWFVIKWPYFYTRNPQYLWDIVMIIWIILFVNSIYFAIIWMLTIFIFLLMPFLEEKWLENMYWKKYLEYKNKTTRLSLIKLV